MMNSERRLSEKPLNGSITACLSRSYNCHLGRSTTPNSCFSPKPLSFSGRDGEREREREREVLITKSNIRRNDFRASAEQQQGAAPAPPMKAPSSPFLSPCITCAINKLFTDVLKATETELPAFRHALDATRPAIHHHFALSRSLCSALFAPRLQKRNRRIGRIKVGPTNEMVSLSFRLSAHFRPCAATKTSQPRCSRAVQSRNH